MGSPSGFTRRSWLLAALGTLAAISPRALRAMPIRPVSNPVHPTPRPGITASKVATTAMLDGDQMLIDLFDSVRAIPHVIDGIRCHCGCATVDGHYSLLTCYETENAMARICPICQGEGRVAARMAKAGRSLDEIRAAIDAQFG